MKYILFSIFLLTSCNITDEATKCNNERIDDNSKVSCGGFASSAYIYSGLGYDNPELTQLKDSAVVLCLAEEIRRINCAKKSHITPANQKGNYFGY